MKCCSWCRPVALQQCSVDCFCTVSQQHRRWQLSHTLRNICKASEWMCACPGGATQQICKYTLLLCSLVTLKADSHIACRAHAVPLPCRAAKGLECVFPIWFTQCGRVWFTIAMPRPCHSLTMPFFSRPRLPARVRLLPATTRSSTKIVIRSIPILLTTIHTYDCKDDLLNCWTSSSDISGYHADCQEGHGTVGAWQGCGMACVN